MGAEQIGDHRTGALVGHQRDLEPGRIIEQRRGEMHDRAAVSDREIGITALLCVDDVLQRLELRIRRHPQHERLTRHSGNRRKGFQRVVGDRLAERDRGREPARCAKADGVAVGLRLGERIHRDHAARTGTVLDDDRLAELLLQLGLHQPRDDIGAAARRMRQDPADRPIRKGAERSGAERADAHACQHNGQQKAANGCHRISSRSHDRNYAQAAIRASRPLAPPPPGARASAPGLVRSMDYRRSSLKSRIAG